MNSTIVSLSSGIEKLEIGTKMSHFQP